MLNRLSSRWDPCDASSSSWKGGTARRPSPVNVHQLERLTYDRSEVMRPPRPLLPLPRQARFAQRACFSTSSATAAAAASTPDYYATLGVARSATKKEIKASFYEVRILMKPINEEGRAEDREFAVDWSDPSTQPASTDDMHAFLRSVACRSSSFFAILRPCHLALALLWLALSSAIQAVPSGCHTRRRGPQGQVPRHFLGVHDVER